MASLLAMIRYWSRIRGQTYPPEPKFSTDDIPDLSGQVMLVTGGNAGIGLETVRVLLEHNAKVYLAARDQKKAELAVSELKQKTGKEALFLRLDLANLASVRRSAEEFLSKESHLHVLFNNAGISTPPIEWLTDDGYDMTFGTNVIGPFLFTKLLLPALLAGTETSHDHHPRVIWLSSIASYLSPLRFDTWKDSPARLKAGLADLYQQSKLANVILAHECAKRYGDKGLVSLSANPGTIKTDIMKHASERHLKVSEMFFTFYPIEYGALTSLWAGTMPEPVQHNGEFAIPWARVGERCRADAYDDKLGKQLWEWLENQVDAYLQE